MTTSSTERFDVHHAITSQIITAIEAGAGDPQMPWHRAGGCIARPQNIASGNGYRGINVVALWAAAYSSGYSAGIWGTYRQWQERGAQVRKGEKSSLIIFYKEFDRDADDDAADPHARRFVAKASRVFNVAQVEGFIAPDLVEQADRIEPVVAADRFITATGARVIEGGDRAFYSVTADQITMPDRVRFTGTPGLSPTEGWYAVLLHELTHWTGASTRLDRGFGERFGNDAYAMEELVAELGAAFLCADLRITPEPRPDHAAYLGHWLRILKADSKAIFTAASAASKAADYLAGLAKEAVP